MGVTGAISSEREGNLKQIDRLMSSSILHGSESLCKLLRYLADQAMENPGLPVKEFQIATEVFGRPHGFDPRLDSTVRVQTGRLRSKLAEYYSGTGTEDPVLVEVPRGSYAVTFHNRAVVSAIGTESPLVRPIDEFATEHPTFVPASRNLSTVLVVLSLALLSAMGVIAYLLATRVAPNPAGAERKADLTALQSFWKSFIDQPAEPLVVFSNAEFTGRPETGMRYFDPARDVRSEILDHYTGVGEVIGMHELDRVFESLHHGLHVKRGRLLSLDDVKNNDVIFVGSPSENLALLEVPTSQDFVFRRSGNPSRKGDLGIVNLHPKEGEQKLYYATSGVPLAEDYAIIALVPGINQTHLAMLLAGTTTIGTQASVEYVCRTDSVEEILRRLTGRTTGAMLPFEAVLRVRISHGVPVASQIVAFHSR